MNRKTYLVARREYMENLRTKAFWIGIFIFPVIITASVVVPTLLERTKGPRTYAVLDESGWLLDAVETRAAMPDLAKVFGLALERYREEDPRFAELPEGLQAVARQIDASASLMDDELAALPEPERAERRRELESKTVDGVARFMTGLGDPGGSGFTEMLPEEAQRELLAVRESIRLWWSELPPEEAKQLGGLSRSRYIRVEAPRGDDAVDVLNRRVADGELFAYFVLGEDPVNGTEGSRYVSNNLTDEDLRDWFASLANAEIRERRLAEKNIDPETARWIQSPLRLDARQIGQTGEEKEVGATDTLRQWAPVVFVYLLWISIFSISQSLLTNTVEEKSNRIIEVLLSSVSPIELMAGKIAGIAATGLTVVASWVVFFLLAAKFLPGFLGGDLDIDLAVIAGDPVFLGSFLIYFLAGYLFFASLLVGIGSVCNSLKEAQNLMSPITIMLMLPLLAMVPIGKDPNGALAKVLSYVPPFTPFVMMNRAAGPPSVMEYVTTTLLLLLSIGVVMWAAAKVFRIGILMTGKAPSLGEILKLLRAPVGQVPVREKS